MYVFSHLHKAAGTTVNHALRRTFGLRHLDVIPGNGHEYTEEDLRSDLSRYIRPSSIAGHCLRPYIDYGELEHAMEWYTIIRNPIDRCISHYQYQVQQMDKKIPFLEWVRNDLHRNWMVYFFGGSDSLQNAIDSIDRKNVRVLDISGGLKEEMQFLFSGNLSWKDKIKNPAQNNLISDEIKARDDLMAELSEANRLDIKLFQYMKQLKTTPFPTPIEATSQTVLLNKSLNFLYRNIVYRPLKKSGL